MVKAAKKKAHILIIGGGGTGAALAHDLALRGLKVSLCEKGEFSSGTTGRHHGLLHSGARYAVHDPVAARECIEENRILRRIAPGSFEENGGLFVALNDDDLAFREKFTRACRQCGIPTEDIPPARARRWEPRLHPNLLAVVRVPDAVMDAWRLPLRFLATARHNGAGLYRYHEVTELLRKSGRITGVSLLDLRTRNRFRLHADLVVLTAGAWSGRLGRTAGIDIPVQPAPGLMVAVEDRLVDMVINRLRPAGDGDIVVPQRRLTIAGTSTWLAEDPEQFESPAGEAQRMIDFGAEMVPALADAEVKAVWSAARPLLAEKDRSDPQGITRRFQCIDHGDRDGLEGLISLIGGKATTLRSMAEAGADLVCQKLGDSIPCQTAVTPLLPHRAFYRKKAL
jgi:glycerol-3-phosphate dehydrogenase